MPEEDLYPKVVEFLEKEKRCLASRKKLGHSYVGEADVFGIKDIGGKFNASIIGYAIEVKETTGSFGKHIGQALGYSLFSHRCYLAVHKKFKEEHIEMANRLGVGLIEIKEDKCEEILTAQHHEPIEDLFLQVVYRLGYVKCKMCGEFFKKVKRSCKSPSKVESGRFYYSKIEKDVFFHGKSRRWSLIICPKCLKDMEY